MLLNVIDHASIQLALRYVRQAVETCPTRDGPGQHRRRRGKM